MSAAQKGPLGESPRRRAGGSLERRMFLETAGRAAASWATVAHFAAAAPQATPSPSATAPLRERVEGLLVGSLLGDALGGPVEFQDSPKVQALPNPPKAWRPGERLDDDARRTAALRLRLRGYGDLRPVPEPYGHWSHQAQPGTVTDDSRHKMVLLDLLRRAAERDAWPIGEGELAEAYLEWPRRKVPDYDARYAVIRNEWLAEIEFSARWVLGERDPARARPPERLWAGLPTCCGQMALPPIAAIFPGRPQAAYLAASSLDFIDNGWGRDMNSALVAGLAAALAIDSPAARPREAWQQVVTAVRATDPYAYRAVPWSQRAVDRWLDFALAAARDADGCPAACFARLDDEFAQTTKWEAHVPFVVVFAVMELCLTEPLAGLQLSIEWGHDTDSYAQLLGAFVGALYGSTIFPAEMRATVVERLAQDYAERLEDWVDLLMRLSESAQRRELFQRD